MKENGWLVIPIFCLFACAFADWRDIGNLQSDVKALKQQVIELREILKK